MLIVKDALQVLPVTSCAALAAGSMSRAPVQHGSSSLVKPQGVQFDAARPAEEALSSEASLAMCCCWWLTTDGAHGAGLGDQQQIVALQEPDAANDPNSLQRGRIMMRQQLPAWSTVESFMQLSGVCQLQHEAARVLLGQVLSCCDGTCIAACQAPVHHVVYDR